MREGPPITFRREALPIILSSKNGGCWERGACPNTSSSFKAIPMCTVNRVTWPPLFVWRTKEDAITWGFELPHKLQGKAHYAKRQVTRKFGMTVKVSTE
jgi:hypothetical protein